MFNTAGGEVAGGEEVKLGWYLERVLAAFGKDVVKPRMGGMCTGPRSCLGRLFRNMKSWWDRQVKVGECNADAGEGGECGKMRGLFNCGGGGGGEGSVASGSGGGPTPAAVVGGWSNLAQQHDTANYLTPASSTDQPTPGVAGSYHDQQMQHEGYPGMGPGIPLGIQDEFVQLGLGGWTLTDEDWTALMNAGGNGLQLFDY